MRIFLLVNNWLGWQVSRWLKAQSENVVGLAVHAPNRSKYRAEIIECVGVPSAHVFAGASLHEPAVLTTIRELHADIAVSVLFGHILRSELIEAFPAGCINLHPSLLPYNRGAHPNVWSIVDKTPAGVTLHYIDRGIDTGDIIAQRELAVSPIDTGASLYRRLERAALDLFIESWASIRRGEAPRCPQPVRVGTSHRVCDLEHIDEIDPRASYKAQELIDLIRARTFPPYPGAHFRAGDRKVYLRIELTYGGEDEK